MRHKPKGQYAQDQLDINAEIKNAAGYRCERCRHPHNPGLGYTLTVHHLDGDKSNNQRWNLAALCQRCHLTIQGKIFLPQFYLFEHSDWFKPHLEGYMNSIGVSCQEHRA